MDYIEIIENRINYHLEKRKYNGYNIKFEPRGSELKLFVKWILSGKAAPSINIKVLLNATDIRTIETENRGNVAENALKDILKDLDDKLIKVNKNTTGEEYDINFFAKIRKHLKNYHDNN